MGLSIGHCPKVQVLGYDSLTLIQSDDRKTILTGLIVLQDMTFAFQRFKQKFTERRFQ